MYRMNSELRDTVAKIRTTVPLLSAHILFVFIIPIILIITGVIPIEYRIIVLSVVVSALFIILIAEKWTLRMLGFRMPTKKEMLGYTIFTFVGVIAISQLGAHIGTSTVTIWWQQPHFLYLFFIVSVLQELAYRGYLMPALASVERSPLAIILTNAVLFAFLHAIFPNYLTNLPLAFVGGIAFAAIYYKYPNLVLIMLSHAVLNFVAVWYGFFTIGGI